MPPGVLERLFPLPALELQLPGPAARVSVVEAAPAERMFEGLFLATPIELEARRPAAARAVRELPTPFPCKSERLGGFAALIRDPGRQPARARLIEIAASGAHAEGELQIAIPVR